MLRIDINLVFTIINLLILYFCMKKFLFGPILKIMEERKSMIAGQFAEAEAAVKEANAKKEQYEDTLKTADAEADAIIEEAKVTAKGEYDRIVSEANSKSESIIKNAEKSAALQHEKTMQNIESEIAGLAMAAAAKVIGGQAEAIDNSKLYSEFINKAGEAYDTNSN